MSRMALIGCGNIGFRHLQAILAMIGIEEMHLTVVEPNSDHHARITSEVMTCPIGGFELAAALPPSVSEIDLAVLATSSDVRKPVLDDLLSARSVKALILEKVLFQTQADLDDAENRLRAAGIRAYVNCGRRGFPGYKTLRDSISGERPIHLNVTGTNYALASNGIHFLDLAEYLNDAEIASLDGAGLDPGTLPSKRRGFIEVSGTLLGQLSNGGTVSLRCDAGDIFALSISIETARRTVRIDEQGQEITWQDGTTERFETRNVSDMPYLYETALSGDLCPLTPYGASAAQHRLFLATLLTHIGAGPEDLCRIS